MENRIHFVSGLLRASSTLLAAVLRQNNGDVLDLSQVLAESQINLGGDFSKLGNYVQVSDSGSNATLSYNGSALAVLNGVGSGVTLSTLISDNALKIN